ncbi:MAG: diaminopimelate decarboxylase [Steroidobacter sp.]
MLDNIDVQALASRIATPFYAYSAGAIRRRITSLKSALEGLDATICFAVKANSNLAILHLMAEAGLGADIVSAGELRRSLRAGIPASRIVFSGVGKSDDEIAEALAAGVWKFNVESSDELHALQRLARERQVIANAAVRINPDVDAGTHDKISTGKSENKFGVSIEEARRWFATANELSWVRLNGLHVHIGSQILNLDPYRTAFERVAAFWRELASAGHRIESIDVGGGLGVRYREDQTPPISPADYADVIREAFANFNGRIVLEPGRYLVAEAGVLLTRVIRVKQGKSRAFLIVDAAMNDLLRPSLYDAWHDIAPVHAGSRPRVRYDVVGPVCETGDTFAIDREMPSCAPGDLLMITGAGAYGATMSSTYNSRPLLAEVLIDGQRYSIIRRRQTYEEMTASEHVAQSWQTI